MAMEEVEEEGTIDSLEKICMQKCFATTNQHRSF